MLAKTIVALTLLLAPAKSPKKPRPPPPVTAPAPKVDAPTVAPPPPAPEAQPPPTVLVRVATDGGVTAPFANALESALEVELRRFEEPSVVTASQLAANMREDHTRQMLGTEGPSAVALATGVTDVLRVDVTASDSTWEIAARRDQGGKTVAQRSASAARDDPAGVQRVAAIVVQALFPEWKARGPAAPAPAGTSRRPLRVAVLQVRATGDVPPRALSALDQSIAPELRKLDGVSAISSSELLDLIGLERQKQLLGCSEESASCLAELAGALDTDEMLTLDLTLVGSTYALTMRRIALDTQKVLQSWLKQFPKRDGEELLAVVGPGITAVFPERAVRPGAVRGVEPEVIRRLNPPPLPRWVFGLTTGLAAAAGATGLGFRLSSLDSQSRYHELLAASVEGGAVPGGAVQRLGNDALARTAIANAAFAAAGALVAAAVVELFFTDWRDDRSAPLRRPAAGALP